MPTQVLTIKSAEKALSPARLGSYYGHEAGDGDVEAISRYLWNMALQAALAPALHVAEVTIRNAVFDATASVANIRGRPFGEIRCWLDTSPSLLYSNEQQAVEEAKGRLRILRKPMTPGYLVSRLSFGFWVNLLNSSYEQGRASGPALWPAALTAFHAVPRKERNRTDLRLRLHRVRSFRNRVAHHESIWDQDPGSEYGYLLETLRYFNPGVERALVAMSPFPVLLQRGSQAYIPEAERLIGQRQKPAPKDDHGSLQSRL